MKKNKLFASLLAVSLFLIGPSNTLVKAAEIPDDGVTSAALIVENNVVTTGISLLNKTYNLYKVFDAKTTEVDDGDDNIEYFVNEDFIEFFEGVLKTEYPTDSTALGYDAAVDTFNHDATDYVNKFAGDGTSTVDKTQTLVTALRTYILGNEGDTDDIPYMYSTSGYAKTGDVETVRATDVDLGYYAIFDTLALAGDLGTDDAVTNGSLVTIPVRKEDGSLTADATITLKGNMPTIEKSIWHDDRTNVEGDYSPLLNTVGRWDEVADYQIGDTVEFRIAVDVPKDISAYDSYTFIVTDLLSDGLSFNKDSIKLYAEPTLTSDPVPGSLHTESYNDIDSEGNPYTFKLDFSSTGTDDTKGMHAIKRDYPTLDVFYIYYTALVTANANISTDYENNNVKLEFSNNPYNSRSKGNVEDDVYGYTFDLDVTKTKGDGVTGLGDAVFALYETKTVNDKLTYTQIYLEQNTDSSLEVPTYSPASGTASDDPDAPKGTITTSAEAKGQFTIAGLDDATSYVLVEIKAPEGYNAANPIRIILTATYAKNTAGIPVPTLTVSGDTNSTDITVINTSAKLLPETGGIGTTLFTISGLVIMAGAVMVLFIRNRKYYN